jgi:hypothetical protein
MLKIDHGQVQIEGALGDLVTEAATLLDGLAKAIEKNSDSDEVTYDAIIESVLVLLTKIKGVNPEDNLWDYDMEIEFSHEAEDLRGKFGADSDFVDIQQGLNTLEITNENTGSKGITGARKANGGEFYIDSRSMSDGTLDVDDLKAIKKLQQKKK